MIGSDADTVHCHPRYEPEPLRIVTKQQWIHNRKEDILEAIERFRRCKYKIPIEWVDELAEHLRALKDER